MAQPFVIRPAELADAPAMARVHVQSWRETYRGLVSDAVLDDPEFLPRRERFWDAALSDPRWAANRSAVALDADTLIGIAMAGPPLDPDVTTGSHLYVLYVLSESLRRGVGSALLDAVLDPAERVVLWVADPNPPTEAFYRRHGFERDGTTRTEDGVPEFRMRRAPRADTRATVR